MGCVCFFPCALIMILLFLGRKENITGFNNKERVLLPFYRSAVYLSKSKHIGNFISKWIFYIETEYKKLYSSKDVLKLSRAKCYELLAKSMLIIMLGSSLAGIVSLKEYTEETTSLKRGEVGSGSTKYELEAVINGNKRKISIDVNEREYSKEELDKYFDYACENIESLILGENESVKEIETDLDLIDHIPDTAIKVDWICSDYLYIQPSGELCYENLTKEGNWITLTATFSYMDYEKKHDIKVHVKRKEYKGIDRYFNDLEDELKLRETKERNKESYQLPKELNGVKVKFSDSDRSDSFVLLILSLLTAICLPLEENSLFKKKQQEKEKQLFQQYPELVCKLSLYLGAGMSISKAWENIALTYIKALKKNQKRDYCNEEVVYTYRQLESGNFKRDSFEEFGSRCRLRPYKKLSMLINSNISKGSSDLAQILQYESREALENRKSEALKMATEASAKLMLPMVMELVVVIAVLMVPAFMSLNF